MYKLKEIEDLLNICEYDLVKLIDFNNNLSIIEDNINKLKDYYDKQYMQDYENAGKDGTHSRVLDQDSIWNVISDQYSEKVKILKRIVQNM